MTEQSVIQALLLVVLVWRVVVCWHLFVRDWAGWEHVRWWKKPKRRKRRPEPYKKPKPFEGLTRKPVCAACAVEDGQGREEAPREAPPTIERTRGRRPSIDTSKHFCCEARCVYHGWLGRGNIIANGHPSGGRWRQRGERVGSGGGAAVCDGPVGGVRQSTAYTLWLLGGENKRAERSSVAALGAG